MSRMPHCPHPSLWLGSPLNHNPIVIVPPPPRLFVGIGAKGNSSVYRWKSACSATWMLLASHWVKSLWEETVTIKWKHIFISNYNMKLTLQYILIYLECLNTHSELLCHGLKNWTNPGHWKTHWRSHKPSKYKLKRRSTELHLCLLIPFAINMQAVFQISFGWIYFRASYIFLPCTLL